MEKLERLKFIMQRIDHYYNGVNTKGTFFLGVNTFILGGCLAAFQSTEVAQVSNIWLTINFLLIAVTGLLSIAFVLWAILPFLSTGSSYDYESVIFFGVIAKKEFKDFKKSIDECSSDAFSDDMTRQIHILAGGLRAKYAKVRNAGFLLFAAVLLVIPFFYQIIKLKS